MSENQRNNGEDEHRNGQGEPLSTRGSSNPEPPVSWMPPTQQGQRQQPPASQPNMVMVGKDSFPVDESDLATFESARKYCVAAQIVALVSLFIGGVLLSSVAVVLAIVGYQKLSTVATKMPQESVKKALKRSGMIAIALSAVALVLNIVSLIVFLPMVEQIVQTGDYGALFGNSPTPSTGTSTTWG